MGCNIAEFEAAVGMSRKWDAREAGREEEGREDLQVQDL